MLEYWKLQDHPFVESADEVFFFPASLHVQALNRLRYMVDNPTMRFGFLGGEPGVGKTAMLLQLCQHCSGDAKYIPAYFGHGSCSPRDVMSALVRRFDKQAAWDRFVDQAWHGTTGEQLTIFSELMRNKVLRLDRHIVVCIDEAREVNEELVGICKAMTSIGASGENGITFLFAGDGDTGNRLAGMPDMATRLALQCELPLLTEAETGAYIDTRMQQAGYRGVTLFDAAARRMIYEHTQGNPREINRLGTMVLERGMVFKERFISADTVYGAIETVLGRSMSA